MVSRRPQIGHDPHLLQPLARDLSPRSRQGRLIRAVANSSDRSPLRRYSWAKSTSSSYPLCSRGLAQLHPKETLDEAASYQKLSFSAACSVLGLFCKPVMTPKLVDPTVTFGSAKIGLFVILKASPRS